MNIHKNCSSLSIWSFYKIIDTEDVRYLIKNYDNDKDIKLTEKRITELMSIWDEIVTEYGLLTVNAKVIKNYRLQFIIAELEFKYSTCINVLDIYANSGMIDVLLILNEFDFNINLLLNLEQQIDIVINKLKSLKNQIKIHKINYTRKYKKNVEDIKFNLDREALILQMNLDLKAGIDVKNTSVERWLNMVELNNEKIELNG